MKKRILQFGMMAKAVMIMMLLGVTGITNAFAYITVGNLKYSINENGVTVIGPKDDYYPTGHLAIPASIIYGGREYSVTKIENLAFASCYGLTSFDIPNSIIEIGRNAFAGTEWWYGQQNGIIYLDNWCLGYKGEQPTGALILNENTRGIANYAFFGCNGLTGNLTIPNSVRAIGVYAFGSCSGFSGNLTIGTSVATIGDGAFYYCKNITEVCYNATTCSCGIQVFENSTGSIIIGDNVTIIPGGLFFYGNFNGTLTIGNSVTIIGEFAFEECGNLTGGLVIPNSVVQIGMNAFANAGFNGELVLSNSLTTIEAGVFSGCGFTGELTLPSSITSIEMSAFHSCSGFTGNLNIPNSVTRIGSFAFCWCSGFTGCLDIPNSVTEIESNAFSWSGFSCISIPNSVLSIGENAFGGTVWCNNQPDGILYLDGWCLGYNGDQPTGDLNIQTGTKGIAGWAFQWCENLTGILTIPESIEHIGDFAFLGCSGLTELHYNAINCSGMGAESPFYECGNLTTLVFGDNVEHIPYGMFWGCGFIGNLIIPNSVTSIGSSAFYNCSGITSVTIGNSVTTMDYGAFDGCTNLEFMTVLAETPPNVYYSFNNVPKSIPVYVPYGTMEAYMSAPGWNEFTNYQEMPPYSTQTIELNAGWNWCSFNLDITLDDLQAALIDTLGNTAITIKSQNSNTSYNGSIWRGQLASLDVSRMYMIQVGTNCQITLTGTPINPDECPITIYNGNNWIAFPLNESMSISEAFSEFAVDGDIIKSQNSNVSFNNGQWRGSLTTLEPGQGYIYKSNANEERTFVFPSDE